MTKYIRHYPLNANSKYRTDKTLCGKSLETQHAISITFDNTRITCKICNEKQSILRGNQ